jgi:GNAT superfamily N-acetyltransferase
MQDPFDGERSIDIRPLRPDDAAWSALWDQAAWGGSLIARRGELLDLRDFDGFVAESDGAPVGLARFAVRGTACELVSLESRLQGRGVGRALMDAVLGAALRSGCRRLWLVTTNDNMRALRFYQQWGMDLVALHLGAIDQARASLKPQIPRLGDHGIPIRHELELEQWIQPEGAAPGD